MLGYLSHTRVLRFAGLFTWAMIAMPLVYTYWPAAEEETIAVRRKVC